MSPEPDQGLAQLARKARHLSQGALEIGQAQKARVTEVLAKAITGRVGD